MGASCFVVGSLFFGVETFFFGIEPGFFKVGTLYFRGKAAPFGEVPGFSVIASILRLKQSRSNPSWAMSPALLTEKPRRQSDVGALC